MTEKPFIHKRAFANVKLNFTFHENIAKILFKLIKKKGIINVGGDTNTAFNFAKKFNPRVKKIYSRKGQFPLNPYMNLSKFKKIIN